MGPGGLEDIISRCPHLSRGRATGHMIQERTTSWKIRGVKESGPALWGILKPLFILAQGVKSTDDPAFATEMTGNQPARAGSGKSNPVVRNEYFFSCFCFSSHLAAEGDLA